MSYPENTDTPEQRTAKEQLISKYMLEYLSCTGPFQGWASARDDFEATIVCDFAEPLCS